MINWLDDTLKVKRQRGRPEVNPFPSDEVEKDFVVRGRKLLDMFYDYSDPNTKNNFVFDDKKRMSKTLFWSLVFIYYIEKKGLNDNLQGYLSALVKHFGVEVTSDRTAMSKRVNMLNGIFVTHNHLDEGRMPMSQQTAHKKYRGRYQFIVKLWEEIV